VTDAELEALRKVAEPAAQALRLTFAKADPSRARTTPTPESIAAASAVLDEEARRRRAIFPVKARKAAAALARFKASADPETHEFRALAHTTSSAPAAPVSMVACITRSPRDTA
jgi:hypothetical protein